MTYQLLSPEEAARAKTMLWQGYSIAATARAVQISESAIASMYQGKTWTYTEWPDGTAGPMPHWRKLEIQNARREARRAKQIKRSTLVKAPQWMQGESPPLSDPRLQTPEAKRLVESAFREADRERQRRYREDLKARGEMTARRNPEYDPEEDVLPPDEIKLGHPSWEEIRGRFPEHPDVAQAEGDEDDLLKLAIRMMFQTQGFEEHWMREQSPTVGRILTANLERLSQENTKVVDELEEGQKDG